MSDTILEVTLWVCPYCSYWREEKSTGQHMVTNPYDRNGPLLKHELVPVRFYSEHHPDRKDGTHGHH